MHRTPQSDPTTETFDVHYLYHFLLEQLRNYAHRGWTPAEFIHILGPRVGPLLYRVAHELIDALPAHLGKFWKDYALQHSSEQEGELTRLLRSPADLESLYSTSYSLRPLPDAQILRTAGFPEHDCGAPSHPDSSTGLGALDSVEPLQPLDPTDVEARAKARHRVLGLLRKAESTTFEQEAAALYAKAQQLRQRHRLQDAELTEDTDGFSVSGDCSSSLISRRVLFSGSWLNYQYLLLGAIASSNGARAIWLSDLKLACVIGHPEDVDYVVELHESLSNQRAEFLRSSPGSKIARRERTTGAYRRTFLASFASRIDTLLKEAKKHADAAAKDAEFDSSGSTTRVTQALARLDQREEDAEAFLKSAFCVSKSLTISAYDQRGWSDGMDAANRSDLRAHRRTLSPF